jgi:hypothetical protein
MSVPAARAQQERDRLKAAWPDAWRDGEHAGPGDATGEPGGSGYPKGFHQWPLDQRNAWFAGFNVGTKECAMANPQRTVLSLRYGWEAAQPQPMGTLVRGLLHNGSVTLFYGPPKSGKSFLLTSCFLAIAARDREWMGHPIVRPGPVLYVACEGHAGFWKRLRAAALDRGWDDQSFPNGFVLATGRPQLIRISERTHAAGPHPDDVIAALNDMKAKAVIPVAVAIDTVFRSVGEGNVNASDHMNAYLAALAEITDQGIALAVVHHETKAGGTPAGSVTLIGGADTIVSTKNGADNGTHTWRVEMAKDDAETKPRAFTLEVVDVGNDADDEPQSSCVVRDIGATLAPKRGRPRGSKAAQNALAALRLATEECGQIPPASNHIPPSVRTVNLALWRRYIAQSSVAGTENPDIQRKAFTRAVHHLQADGFIGIWNDNVWLTDK